MREFLRYTLTLTIICLVTASLLAGVYLLTRPKILEQKEKAEKEAQEAVMPEAGYFEPVIKENQTVYFRAYKSQDKRRLIGYVFRTKARGYSSEIETMAGMDTQGEITGIRVLEQNETPGLGARIEEVLVKKTLWQRIKEIFKPKQKVTEISAQPWFCAQFKGKEIKDLIVVSTPTEENIQAVTGATISSQALTDSVREKAKEILGYEQ